MAGWYRQGTVALTPGSAAVAGTGTMWMGVVRPGSAFTIDGRTLYEIREVANDHTLTLDRPWEGETAAASTYAVIAASATLSNAELANEIAAMVAKWAVREDQYDDWLGGSPNGGPNADGKYPLTDSKGVTRLVESPARLLQLLDDGVVEHAAQIIAAIEDDVATARQAATDATAAIAAVAIDRQAVAQAAAIVAAQSSDSTAAAATATAQAAIATQHADEAAGSTAIAAGHELSVTAALSAVETARDIVLEAQTEAATAAAGALSSRTAVEAARDIAAGARDTALEARDAAETARVQAQNWAVKTDAPVSGSLKSALSYALEAASQATAAIGKAQEAAGSATAAAASAADLDSAAADAQAAAGSATTSAQTATAKAAAAALSADLARSAAQEAEIAGTGSATARAAAEAARDTAATAMTAAQVAATQAGQSQTNAANSAQTAATAAADAISAKSDATAARDLAAAARTEAQGARDLAQAFAQGAPGYQPSPGVYSAFHWSEQAKGHAQTAATIVGGSNFGIVGDGISQRFAADNPGSLLNLVQAPGGKLTFNPGNRAVSFGFDATTAPVAASGGITAGTVQGALEEIDHRLSTLSQDSIANGGGSVQVTADGTVEIAPAAGRTATYKGGELHTSATAYSKTQTDAAIATATGGLATVAHTGAYGDLLDKPDVYTRTQTNAAIAAGQSAGSAKLTTARSIALAGGVTGTATAFDGSANIVIPVTSVASSALTGTIDIARLPVGALERLYPVATDTERFALTTAQVQKGDTVQVGGTSGLMYLVIDESNLGNSAGYAPYTAARASAVDWSGVESKPALLSAIASLDAGNGVLVQSGAGTVGKRAVGVASSTDIPDRAAADTRYARTDTTPTFVGAIVATPGIARVTVADTGPTGGQGFAEVLLRDDGGAADQKRLSLRYSDGAGFQVGRLNDAETGFTPWLSANSSGAFTFASTPTVAGNSVWHGGNFNPSLKADKTTPVFTGRIAVAGSGAYMPVGTSIAQANAGNPGGYDIGGLMIEAQVSGTTPGAAFLSFSRPYQFGAHLGLDTDNKLKIGGWSFGNNAYEIWHAGSLPVTVSGQTVDFKAQPTVNGQPLAGNSVGKSAVTVLPAAGTLNVTAKTILGVYSQYIGQTFNVDYNTEAQYTQENAATGTDQVAGAFQLYNTAGAQIDSATKLLIHADGVNGSTEIIDERGITPFGGHCGWFDGSSAWKVPSGFKTAFGSAQNFTFEGMVYISGNFTDRAILDICDESSYTIAQIALRSSSGSPIIKYYAAGVDRIQSTALSNNTWYRWAAVRSGGVTTLYIEGVSQGTWTDTTNFSGGVLGIGMSAGNPGTYNFCGWMDQIRVSKIARYTSNFTPSTIAFVTDADTAHLFTFDDGHGGQVLKDRANSGHEVAITYGSISTATAKFGTSSLACNNDANGGAMVAMSKAHADLYLGSDNFTIDFHAKVNNWASNNSILFVLDYTNGWGINFRTGGGNLQAQFSTNNTNFDVIINLGATTNISIGVWHHYALTRSGSTIYAFIDGVLVGSVNVGTASITPWLASNGCKLAIGRIVSATGGYALNGNIDEFRIKRGEAVWTANFTPPTAPYTADDRTVLLLHFDGANNDKVTFDSSRSSYSGNVFGSNGGATLTFAGSAALSTAYTRGGHGTSLTLNGSSQYACIQFDTPIAGHPIYFGTHTKFCIEGWFYLASTNGSPMLFEVTNGSGNQIYLVWAGTQWLVSIGTNTFNIAGNLTTGWHHVALVRDGRGYSVYIDGVSSAAPVNPHFNAFYESTAYTLWLGTQRTIGNWMNGAIDSFRITNGHPRYTANFTPTTLVSDDATTLMWEFNGAVGQKWVKELSQNTALITANGNARTVKDGRYLPAATGATLSTDFSAFGTGSILFDGTNPGVDLGTGSEWQFTGDFTIDTRLKLSAINRYHTIAAKGGAAAASGRAWDFSVNSSNKLALNIYVGTTIYSAVGATSLTAGAAYHVAAVRSGNTLMVFLNGTLDGSAAMSGTMNTSTTAARLGSFYNGTSDISISSAYFDEFRISNTARWTSNFTPPAMAYGQQFVTGPFHVATMETSSIDVSDWSTIHSATITQNTPPGTSIRWAVSFDGRATWKYWAGSVWASLGSLTGANLDANGNDYLTFQTALAGLNVEAYASLDFAYSLKTANPNNSPSVDNITISRDEYQQAAPKIDYTIKRNGAAGSEVHRITNLNAYPVNIVYDYIA